MINYIVQAQVIDIAVDSPKAEDIFLVDSNVWYWMTYTRASQGHSRPQLHQISTYPTYVKKALEAGSSIYLSTLSFAELTHLIEKTEREIYQKLKGREIKSKEYRHNFPEERSRVISEVEVAWDQVVSLGKFLIEDVDEVTTKNALFRFQKDKVDGYDLFILESMKKGGIIKIITDDGDFSSVSDIHVFTANQSVISAARKKNKLVKR